MKTLQVSNQNEWRSWLEKNHTTEDGVWLVFFRKGSGEQSISYQEALDEALAYGWIDSIIKKVDEKRYVRKFTPRRPWSIWSRLNIERVDKLTKDGRMTSWGLSIYKDRPSEISLLEKLNLEGVKIPQDFEDSLRKSEKAWKNFMRFGVSYKKRYLVWISGAKTPQTRAKRIAEAVVLISKNIKALLK